MAGHLSPDLWFNKKADFIPVRMIEKMTGIRSDHVHETSLGSRWPWEEKP